MLRQAQHDRLSWFGRLPEQPSQIDIGSQNEVPESTAISVRAAAFAPAEEKQQSVKLALFFLGFVLSALLFLGSAGGRHATGWSLHGGRRIGAGGHGGGNWIDL